MSGEVNEDFKKYLDEKFNNLNEKIDKALRFESRINRLEAENSQLKEALNSRPTVYQVIGGLSVVLFLAIGIATLIFEYIS